MLCLDSSSLPNPLGQAASFHRGGGNLRRRVNQSDVIYFWKGYHHVSLYGCLSQAVWPHFSTASTPALAVSRARVSAILNMEPSGCSQYVNIKVVLLQVVIAFSINCGARIFWVNSMHEDDGKGIRESQKPKKRRIFSAILFSFGYLNIYLRTFLTEHPYVTCNKRLKAR